MTLTQLHAYANFLYLLSVDAAMSSALPFRSHYLLLDIACNMTGTEGNMSRELVELKKYCPELSALLTELRGTHLLGNLLNLITFLVHQITAVHSNDRPIPEASRIPNSYNPASGIAMYFTEHGEQLRKQPHYVISGNVNAKTSNNYDDKPDEPCNKEFPYSSRSGFGYMFIWLCPLHGHVYGFHLIPGAEGRKDPFSSVFKYMETAPEEVFYDYACGFSEYYLNREPLFFKKTRAHHDIFHGMSHKCGLTFEFKRLKGFEGCNTEIAEQFNSYLQRVKYTASSLSQSHFILFLQFFCYLWNKGKTGKYEQLVSNAVGGMK